MMERQKRIAVCANASQYSKAALRHASELCKQQHALLLVVHVTALNPPSSLPYLDHLEKANNMQILEESRKDKYELEKYLREELKADYELVEVAGEGEIGPLIEEWALKAQPDCVVVGTRSLGTLKKWVLGSTSEYLLHHLQCPVTVVKSS